MRLFRRGQSLEERRANAYHRLFCAENGAINDPGLIVLGDLTRQCYVLESTFVDGDPYATARNEGKREVFLHVQKLIKVDIARIIEIMTAEFDLADEAQRGNRDG